MGKRGSAKAGEDKEEGDKDKEEGDKDKAVPHEGNTLLLELVEPIKKRRRQNGRRCEDEQLERSIQQHFAHLPVITVETTRVDGLLVRDRIAKDKEQMKGQGGNSRLGAAYWRKLVQLYPAGVEGVQTIKIKNLSLPVQDALVHGLGAACKTNPATRAMEPLIVFLQHTQPLNEKELVGMSKALDSCKSMGKANSDLVMVEVMKCLVRAKQTELFADQIDTMKASFDDALTRHS